MRQKQVFILLFSASMFITGATQAYLGAMTPVHAITSVDELSDVSHSHWAFEALRDLVEKYDVIKGYPSLTFRGDRAPTRWEMAAALDALVKTIGRDLARMGAEKANKADLETVARLQDEFKNELSALNARVGALEGRAAVIEAKNEQQDNRLTLLEKTQIHGDFTIGGLSDMSDDGISRVNGRGNNGILDGLSTIGRLRLSVDVPVREDKEDSKLGKGEVFARLVSAFGRIEPNGANSNNAGAFDVYNGYSRIASDASNYNEGLNTASTSATRNAIAGGNNLRPNTYLETAYFQQHLKAGIPLLTDVGLSALGKDWQGSGDFYAGLMSWRSLFGKSPYRGNELTQFQNIAFATVPAVEVNYYTPTMAYRWSQHLGKNASFALTSSVASMNVGDVYDGITASYEGRLNYNTSFISKDWAKPGSVYAGGYNYWKAGNTFGLLAPITATNQQDLALRDVRKQDNVNAFYAGWDQEWYKGIGTTVNYLWNNQGEMTRSAGATHGIYLMPRQGLAGVLNIPVGSILPGIRAKDIIGVGYSLTDFYENGLTGNKYGDKTEKVLETYYNMRLTDNISVIPSVQLIWNRLGLNGNGLTTVVGVRTSLTF